MSMPKFPEIGPEVTCANAINMILLSIAMEELALSHIINAEGEKLQYLLGAFEKSGTFSVDEILAVNQSITALLDSVSQNQMILKNKMDKALHTLSYVSPQAERKCTCSAVFKTEEKCHLWHAGTALRWDMERLRGKCVRFEPCDKTKIELCCPKRFMVSFAVNVNVKSNSALADAVSISLQLTNTQARADIYTARGHMPKTNTTISMGGIVVETSEHHAPYCLSLRLVSSEPLIVENAMLNIVEI